MPPNTEQLTKSVDDCGLSSFGMEVRAEWRIFIDYCEEVRNRRPMKSKIMRSTGDVIDIRHLVGILQTSVLFQWSKHK